MMRACITEQKLQTVKDFNLFAEFLEAIVAYHKFCSISET